MFNPQEPNAPYVEIKLAVLRVTHQGRLSGMCSIHAEALTQVDSEDCLIMLTVPEEMVYGAKATLPFRKLKPGDEFFVRFARNADDAYNM